LELCLKAIPRRPWFKNGTTRRSSLQVSTGNAASIPRFSRKSSHYSNEYLTCARNSFGEVDFLWQSPQGGILPLEAKSGINPKSKSLRIYEKKFHPARLLRTTPLNLRQDGKILNIPLYALTALDRLAS
jgi:hypothetical protein